MLRLASSPSYLTVSSYLGPSKSRERWPNERSSGERGRSKEVELLRLKRQKSKLNFTRASSEQTDRPLRLLSLFNLHPARDSQAVHLIHSLLTSLRIKLQGWTLDAVVRLLLAAHTPPLKAVTEHPPHLTETVMADHQVIPILALKIPEMVNIPGHPLRPATFHLKVPVHTPQIPGCELWTLERE
jgi:hypothetical protein